jgi:hypothetical protein
MRLADQIRAMGYGDRVCLIYQCCRVNQSVIPAVYVLAPPTAFQSPLP